MLVKTEGRIPIFPGTDFYFPSTSVPPGTFFRLCTTECEALPVQFCRKKTKTDSELL